jgi:polysaccharide export outer membrane protein
MSVQPTASVGTLEQVDFLRCEEAAYYADCCKSPTLLTRQTAEAKSRSRTLAMYLLFIDGEGKSRRMGLYSLIRLSAILVVASVSLTMVQAQKVAASDPKAVKPQGEGYSSEVPPADTRIAAESSQFALGVADVIRVNVWKNTDLSQTVTVGPDGFVSLPLLGDVHVAGMTANQLAQNLSSRLNAYVVSVQVTVSVVEIRSRQVFVMGQVAKPGQYSLVAPVTVLQLIAQAGGLNTFAKRKEIFVLRGAKTNAQRLKFNYNNAIRGDEHENIDLQPGDTVVVP